MSHLTHLTAILLASAAAAPAIAQDARTMLPAEPAQQSTAAIEEIIVTAQRRGENLQKVPIAITAVTAKALQSLGITNTTDIMRVAPGLQFQQSVGLAAPYIRGIGVSGQAAGVEASVATYIDGVYISSGGDAVMSLNNIERVEVLKGPQGTLFGRNASGGLVQVITRTPKFTPAMEASLSYDQWETVTASAYVTAGLSDTVAADLAVRYSSQGQGWGIDRNTGKDTNRVDHDFAARSKLLFQPTDATKIVVTGDYSDFKGSTYVIDTIVEGSVGSGGYVMTGNPWDNVTQLRNPFRATENWGVSGDLTQELGFANLRSITAYRKSVFDLNFEPGGLPTPTVVIPGHIVQKQFSQELQLLSPDSSKIKWIAGLYYFHGASPNSSGHAFLYPFLTGLPGPIFVYRYFSHNVNSLAAFAQATVPITDQLNLTGGIRWTRDRFTYKNTSTTDLTSFLPVQFGGLSTVVYAPRKDTQSRPTWRLALDYQVTPDALVYASYNRGFKSGGFDIFIGNSTVLKPEIVDAYEVGTKIEALDKALRFNTAVFYHTVKNLQMTLLFNGSNNLRNAASAEAYGAEVEITAVPFQGLTLTASGSYLHSRFTDFRGNAPISTALPGGGNAIDPNGDATGNRTPKAPDMTFNLSANYETPLAGGKLGLNGSWFWSDKWYADPDNRLFQPSYHMISGEISWTEPSDHLRFRVFVRNLANEKVAAQFGSLVNGDVWQLTEPRTIGAGIDFKF